MSALTVRERLVLGGIALFALLAGVAKYAGAPALLAFVAAGLAAYVVSFSTEQVGERFSPAVTGLLQSTLGNLPELFVVIFALRAGEIVVAQTSILGSLFANALLVLGFVIVVGARASEDGIMRFGSRLPRDTATLMLVTVFIIVVVGQSLSSRDPASHHVKTISGVAAACLLVVYCAWVIPYVRTPGEEAVGRGSPRGSRLPRRSGCSPSPAWARHSSRSGSWTRCARRSTSSASRTPSRAS